MASLATILGTGKGTWHEVHALLDLRAFERAVVFIDEWAAKTYKTEHQVTLVPIPERASAEQLKDIMTQHLKAITTHDFDLAINIASGTGTQHAALLAAALSLGVGIRLVSVTDGQLQVLT